MGGESQPCQQTSFSTSHHRTRYFIVLAGLSAIRIIGAARYSVIAGVLLNLYIAKHQGRNETTRSITFVSNATAI